MRSVDDETSQNLLTPYENVKQNLEWENNFLSYVIYMLIHIE